MAGAVPVLALVEVILRPAPAPAAPAPAVGAAAVGAASSSHQQQQQAARATATAKAARGTNGEEAASYDLSGGNVSGDSGNGCTAPSTRSPPALSAPPPPPSPLLQLSSAVAKLQLRDCCLSSGLVLHLEEDKLADAGGEGDTDSDTVGPRPRFLSGTVGLVLAEDDGRDERPTLGLVPFRTENPCCAAPSPSSSLLSSSLPSSSRLPPSSPLHCYCECRGYIPAASVELGLRRRWMKGAVAPGHPPGNGENLLAVPAAVTDATLVVVVRDEGDKDEEDEEEEEGDANENNHLDFYGEPVLSYHDPGNVRQLQNKISRMLQLDSSFSSSQSSLPLVGTTTDAASLWTGHLRRVQDVRQALRDRRRRRRRIRLLTPPSIDARPSTNPAPAASCPAAADTVFDHNHPRFLIVHSPHHGEGKTALVRALLRRLRGTTDPSLGGSTSSHVAPRRISIRVVDVGQLLARYGVHADAALETIVHQLALQSAVRNSRGKVNASCCCCLVLDGLEAIVPGLASNASPRQQGDAAGPVLNNMASYLQGLGACLSPSLAPFDLDRSGRPPEIPFPVRNVLYNAGGSRGFALPVRFGVVGIVTCPDDAFSDAASFYSDSGVPAPAMACRFLASIRADRFRLPTLSIEARHTAFRRALHRQHVTVDADLDQKLPWLVPSWVRGISLDRVAKHLRAIVESRAAEEEAEEEVEASAGAGGHGSPSRFGSAASVRDFTVAMSRVGQASAVSATATASYSSSSTWSTGSNVEHLPAGAAVAAAAPSRSQDSPPASPPDDWFSSVGGNRRAKVALQEALALDPVRRGRLEALGLSPPTGILLYGPPGVGKTLLAKAVAALLRQNASGGPAASAAVGSGGAFVSLSSVDLVRAEVGASEKLVVEAFEAARASAPSVVFIDEFQALFADRSASAEGGGSGRMTTSLLECMDDVRKWSDVAPGLGNSAVAPRDGSIRTGGRVVVLAATNTPWMIDGAFLRPGRFDRAVFVGLPTQDERASILRLHVGRMRTHLAEGGSLNGLCSRLAALTDGFSGADLAALCRAAAVRCLLEASGGGDGALAAKAAVEERHLLEARERDVQASTSDKLVRRIEQWGVRG